MKQQIQSVSKKDYQEIVEVWEASVRATHHFLKEEDIAYYKPLILNQYLDAVQLRCVKGSDHQILGFLGVANTSIEMLFIHPSYRGKGVGKSLLNHAIQHFKTTHVDVNEQNEQAVGFYQYHGFDTVKRSAIDGSGKPYPILHMALKKS